MKRFVVLLCLWSLPSVTSAQTVPLDPCLSVPAGTIFVVTSGRPPRAAWLMNALVPVSETDPTLVPQRIDGFYLQVDSSPRFDTGPLVPGAPCPSGENAGMLPYVFQMLSGVSRGSHILVVAAWNFILDTNGQPTGERQEGLSNSIPFVAVDLTHLGPPRQPARVIIGR